MGWLKQLFGSSDGGSQMSRNAARERLPQALSYDRSEITPGLIEEIKGDIIDAVARRLAIDPENVVVKLTSTSEERAGRIIAVIPLRKKGKQP